MIALIVCPPPDAPRSRRIRALVWIGMVSAFLVYQWFNGVDLVAAVPFWQVMP